jgi:hypothetical protein
MKSVVVLVKSQATPAVKQSSVFPIVVKIKALICDTDYVRDDPSARKCKRLFSSNLNALRILRLACHFNSLAELIDLNQR